MLVLACASLISGCRDKEAVREDAGPAPIPDETYAQIWLEVHGVPRSGDEERFEYEIQRILDTHGVSRESYKAHGKGLVGERARLVGILEGLVESHPVESVMFARSHGLVDERCVEAFRRRSLEYVRGAVKSATDGEEIEESKVRIARDTLILCGALEGVVSEEVEEPPPELTAEQICADPRWTGTLPCREEIPGRVDLFVMSRCPYGVGAGRAVMPVLEHLGDAITLRLHFVVEVLDALEYEMYARKHWCLAYGLDHVCSMHGPDEVEEDVRQACVQDLYPEDHAFMRYVLCRGEDPDGDWKPCAKGMDTSKIEQCAGGARGLELISRDAELARKLDVHASPTWLFDNTRIEKVASDPRKIKDEICSRAEGLKACKRPLKVTQKIEQTGGCKM
jgi:hypothetical protein